MADLMNNYMFLRKYAYRSYWEKRILSQIGYLGELIQPEDTQDRKLIQQVVSMLLESYRENKQLDSVIAQKAESMLLPLSEKAKGLTILCAAHAHIDMNWEWGFQETVTATVDTMRTMLQLMEEYPDFVFSQSQASVYHILEEYAPELLEQIKQHVHNGRWEVTASTWVEHDKNLPSGESLVRQLLYTKKYLSSLLEISEDSLNFDFEPDTFGHSRNLPEILVKAGVTRYYHCRGFEEDNLYRWRANSGAEVLVCFEPGWYNTEIEYDLCDGLPAFCKKYGLSKALYVYGVGDHGGGPTRRDLNRILDMQTWPLFPQLRFSTYKEFFDHVETRKHKLRVVQQELNYVFTGCYTSQSRVKMANCIGQARLVEAEILDSMARIQCQNYESGGSFEKGWRKILFSQFHDILPGSCVIESREYAMGEFQKTMAITSIKATRAMDAVCDAIVKGNTITNEDDVAMGAGAGYGSGRGQRFGSTYVERGGMSTRYVALFNTTQITRTTPTEVVLWDWPDDVNNVRASDMEGNEYPIQYVGREDIYEGRYWGHYCDKFLVWLPIPPFGYKVCKFDSKPVVPHSNWETFGVRVERITDEPICLENEYVKAAFNASTMQCISLIDKNSDKQLIPCDEPACSLLLITEETENQLTAWRVGRTAKMMNLNVEGIVQHELIQLDTPRQQIAYRLECGDICAKVCISLDQGSRHLNFDMDVHWPLLGSREKGIPQLRFHVPCSYLPSKYRYPIPFGVIDRDPLAQDVPALQMGCAIDGTEDTALYLACDSKYGFRGDGKGLSVNLLRSSYDPDPYPEVGNHLFHIRVGACNPQPQNIMEIQQDVLYPVSVRSCRTAPEPGKDTNSLFSLEGGVLSAIKQAEDHTGYILRIWNPNAEKSVVTLSLPHTSAEVYLCDVLERKQQQLEYQAGVPIQYSVDANEVSTLRIVPSLELTI